jgi:acyl-CoA thioester hydrolase
MAHVTEIRVRYQETDRMGVVYYGNFFIWFEVARTEFFRRAGVVYRELEEKERLRFMVVDAQCSYKAPATYDDLLTIETVVTRTRNTSLTFSYRVCRGEEYIATGETSHVFTDEKGKPVRIPGHVREALVTAAA